MKGSEKHKRSRKSYKGIKEENKIENCGYLSAAVCTVKQIVLKFLLDLEPNFGGQK